MNKWLLIILMALSLNASALTLLTPENSKPYANAVREEAAKYSVSNGVPLDKQSFSITSDGKKLGVFISGHGQSEQGAGIYFAAWRAQQGRLTTVIPTIGKENWQGQTCKRTLAVGVLSEENPAEIKIGVIYEVIASGANAFASAIFSVDKAKRTLSLDRDLTSGIGSQPIANLAGLKQWYQGHKPPEATARFNVVQQVQKAVEEQKLVKDPACVEYQQAKDGEPGLTLVDVMEKHGGHCPGDIQIKHRLFSIYVDNVTHQMLTDKDDPEEGTFSLLPDIK